MKENPNPAQYIRTHVFRMSQQKFGPALGVNQATVSRWEKLGFVSLQYHQAIRNLARTNQIAWSNLWFIETPDGRTADEDCQRVVPQRRRIMPKPIDHHQNGASTTSP